MELVGDQSGGWAGSEGALLLMVSVGLNFKGEPRGTSVEGTQGMEIGLDTGHDIVGGGIRRAWP